jgi:hypothetical protein
MPNPNLMVCHRFKNDTALTSMPLIDPLPSKRNSSRKPSCCILLQDPSCIILSWCSQNTIGAAMEMPVKMLLEISETIYAVYEHTYAFSHYMIRLWEREKRRILSLSCVGSKLLSPCSSLLPLTLNSHKSLLSLSSTLTVRNSTHMHQGRIQPALQRAILSPRMLHLRIVSTESPDIRGGFWGDISS